MVKRKKQSPNIIKCHQMDFLMTYKRLNVISNNQIPVLLHNCKLNSQLLWKLEKMIQMNYSKIIQNLSGMTDLIRNNTLEIVTTSQKNLDSRAMIESIQRNQP